MTKPTSPPVTVETLKRWGWTDYSSFAGDDEYGTAMVSPENRFGGELFVCLLGTPDEQWRYDDSDIPAPASESDLAELCWLLGIPRE